MGTAFCVEAEGGEEEAAELEEEEKEEKEEGDCSEERCSCRLRSWGTAGAPDPPPTSLMPLQK